MLVILHFGLSTNLISLISYLLSLISLLTPSPFAYTAVGGGAVLGWIRWGAQGKPHVERRELLGLSLLVLHLSERERGMERRVSKGARLLTKNRVNRVLVPPDFAWWSALRCCGLRPVETRALRCALAPVWVEAALAARGIRREQAVVCLRGGRESPEMLSLARQLCPRVRNLTFDVPGECKAEKHLRREFGLPVLPARAARPDLVLRLEDGPVLEGARFALRGKALPEDCEGLSLLSALWECGRIKTEDIRILVDFP